jgi:mRNA interferase RelE/StbE
MFQIQYTPEAIADLDRLPSAIRVRVFKKIQWLADKSGQIVHKPLKENWADFFKLRVGDYRVILRS